MTFLTVVLNRRLISNSRDDDLSVLRFIDSMYGEKISIQDVCILHAVATDT
jgi:hypothetical protein